jgi:hypothetical protein
MVLQPVKCLGSIEFVPIFTHPESYPAADELIQASRLMNNNSSIV